jgi:cell division protein FtsZ
MTTAFGSNQSAASGFADIGVAEPLSSMPAVFKPSPNRGAIPSLGASSSPQAKSLLEKGADFYDIPAFLRKQAD